MNMSLLTIDTNTASKLAAYALPFDTAPNQKTGPFDFSKAKKQPAYGAPVITTTDNTSANTQSSPISKPDETFEGTFGHKIKAEKPLEKATHQSWANQDTTYGEGSQISLAMLVSTPQLLSTAAEEQVPTETPVKQQSPIKNAGLMGILQTKTPAGSVGNAGNEKPVNLTIESKALPNITNVQPVPETASHEQPPLTDSLETAGPLNVGKTTLSVPNEQEPSDSLETAGPKTSSAAGENSAASSLNVGKTTLSVPNEQEPSDSVGTPPEFGPKPSDLQSGSVLTNPPGPTTATQEPADNKQAPPGHQSLQPSELSDANTENPDTGLAGDSLPKDLNAEQGHTFASQVKNHDTVNNDSSEPTSFEQMLDSGAHTAQFRTLDQPSAEIQPEKTLNTTDLAPDIRQQIQESISTSVQQGDRQITIRLNPPELGRVYMKFLEQGDQITGVLEATKAQTRIELQQALPEIIRNLADSGIQIKRLDVTVSDADRFQQGAFQERYLATGQDGSSQHGPANPGQQSSSDNIADNQWPENIDLYTHFSEPGELFITDNSINMYV